MDITPDIKILNKLNKQATTDKSLTNPKIKTHKDIHKTKKTSNIGFGTSLENSSQNLNTEKKNKKVDVRMSDLSENNINIKRIDNHINNINSLNIINSIKKTEFPMNPSDTISSASLPSVEKKKSM